MRGVSTCMQCFFFKYTDLVIASPNANSLSQNVTKLACKWVLRLITQIESGTLAEEDNKNWEVCREAMTTFSFTFGHVHSPYWGEERKKIIPKFEMLKEILDYLRSLILGCNLELELKTNTQILEKEWWGYASRLKLRDGM
ncbi:hypothetical protein UlMin_001120 [Ulmus minor]